MSPNSIEKFLGRLQQAQRSKSREVILSAEEATELHMAITHLLTRQTQLLEEVVDLAKRANNPGPTEIDMDGGGF